MGARDGNFSESNLCLPSMLGHMGNNICTAYHCKNRKLLLEG
jgi:hypothetical protein